MVIDKIWTSLGKHEKAFYTGLKKFFDDYKTLVDSAGNIRCPCKSCRLVLWVSIKPLSDHILKYGFDPSYKTWIHHGEPDLPSPQLVIDNTRQPPMSDMTVCFNDLSYIPLNNEQNKPTQGDISKTSNDLTQAKRNNFEELYASANEKLYPGCDYVTRLDFMAKFTYFKVKGYKLPPSYYAIKKTFKMIGLGYESIHACVNDCYLFWCDANKDVHFCPVYNTSRWKDSNTPGKKVSKKVLRYFLIIPRLQHLYKSSHTAKKMTWHATRKCMQPGKMQHPVDGRAWKDFDTKYLNFTVEPRNSSLMLTLLIPGPKSPGNDIDVYLRLLIDDLKDLWGKPVIRIDRQELKKVIWYVLHNSPEIDTYQAMFKSEFSNKDMKEEFLGWFGKQINLDLLYIRQRHVDNDPGVSESNELFALACGRSQTPILVNSCVINSVTFVVHSRDERRTTQNNEICLPGPDEEMYYALHIDGQSIDVDAPPDIIDVVDEDDDIIDEEYPIPLDLADSVEEDLVNLDIDDGVNILADVAWGHGGGDDDRPPSYQIPTSKGTQKSNLGGRRAGRMHTRHETYNLGLKAITDKNSPVPIRFEFGDRETLMPLGDHAAHWANYLEELVREFSLHNPS
nr:hypothetical protein [Tanacetum cinerariifolium]